MDIYKKLILLSIENAFILSAVMKAAGEWKYRNWPKTLISWIVMNIAGLIMDLYFGINIIITALVVYTFSLKCLIGRKMLASALYTFMGIVIGISMEFLALSIVAELSPEGADEFIISLISFAVAFIFMNIFFTLLDRSKIVEKFERESARNSRLIPVILIGIFIFTHILVYILNLAGSDIVSQSYFVGFIMAVRLIVLYFTARNVLSYAVTVQSEREYYKYLPIIEELIDEVRAKQHEFDNHIQVLKMGGNKETEDYIKRMSKDHESIKLLKLSNKMLAGFLFEKIKSAKMKNVRLDINIEDYFFDSGIPDYDFMNVVNNLLNNAFETDDEDKHVILNLKKNGVVEVKNKTSYLSDSKLEKMFEKGYSTKNGSKRGYGLYNVYNIIKKYDGDMFIINEKSEDKNGNKSKSGDNYLVFRIKF